MANQDVRYYLNGMLFEIEGSYITQCGDRMVTRMAAPGSAWCGFRTEADHCAS
ncbi:hypothetical protein OK016_09260 [Vibrio chagasii]|nr:hypothetical protein [Vibrio chagasii]